MKPTLVFSPRFALLAISSVTLAISAPLLAADGPEPTVKEEKEEIKGSEAAPGTPSDVAADKKEMKEAKDDKAADEAPKPPVATADPQMQAVLDELAAMGGEPLNELTAEDARKQPSPADAVKKLMDKQGKDGPEKVHKVDNIEIKLSSGDVKGRVYRPEGDGPFPVILYIHGGGWVIADLDTYDSTPRALCNAANALVISTHYRQAPEHKFPAAHEDAFGAYQWTLQNAGRWGGDAKKVAVVGESAGANMAVSVSMMAQAAGAQMPIHQVLVYPVASTSMDTPSYRENALAKPLNAMMMKWFFDNTFAKPEDSKNHQINLLGAKTLEGLPGTTVITAEIDPLRSDGEALAEKLKKDGVPVSLKNYEGVTHEFFGMGAVVDKAKDAVGFAAANLKQAFDEGTAAVAPADE